MYDELIKRLRCQLYGNCPACVNWYTEEVEPNLWRERCVAIDAADAIEELRQQVEHYHGCMNEWFEAAQEYKAAYCEEHNRRMADNRYFYDELTKAVRETLLMTPMRIEVPQPPKEEIK